MYVGLIVDVAKRAPDSPCGFTSDDVDRFCLECDDKSLGGLTEAQGELSHAGGTGPGAKMAPLKISSARGFGIGRVHRSRADELCRTMRRGNPHMKTTTIYDRHAWSGHPGGHAVIEVKAGNLTLAKYRASSHWISARRAANGSHRLPARHPGNSHPMAWKTAGVIPGLPVGDDLVNAVVSVG